MTDVAALLTSLIPFRTDFPGGDEQPLARHLRDALAGWRPDELAMESPDAAHAFVFARWGEPRLLVNAHLDTVPPGGTWSSDPFTPREGAGRIHGLGAADTKGAIAAILSALGEVTPRNVAVLFSGDEEREGRCMNAFLASSQRRGLTHAVVCEPTRCQAGARHRGVLALEISVEGPGGHSSRADRTRAPLAELARLATAFDEWGQAHRGLGPRGFEGMCVNIARLDGGIAFNVIPSRAKLTVSVRCPPGADHQALRAELTALARRHLPDAVVHAPVDHPAFATRDPASFERWLGKVAPVDLAFWTEAALLSQAGIDAVVFGPGDIAQAHGADEWVEVEQLERARRAFVGVFRQAGAHGAR